jgi:hypothetical protein
MIEQCIEIAKNYPSDLTVGNASFNKIEFKGGRMDGYLEHRFLSEHFDVARLERNGNTWMSITPMELESHITHVLEATGDVLVGGLGMGYYITQIVSKPDVKSVIVIEKDMEVIEAYNALIKTNPTYFSNGKLHIIQGDLFETIPTLKETNFDYTYLDIWLSMDFDLISSDFEKINDLCGIRADRVGFWGMEKFVYGKVQNLQWHYDPEEMSELIKEELCSEFGEVMEWCYKPSIELMIQLAVGENEN